jgi:hypothetical protein
MAFSLFKKDTQRAFLVFDVGNGSVGGALVARDKGGGLKIVSSSRADIPTGEKVDFGVLFKDTLRAVDEIVTSLTVNVAAANAPIFVILASPWYVSQTKIINVKDERGFTLTKDLCDDLVSKEISEFEESLRKGNEGKTDDLLGIIESRIIHTTLNGYETPKPIGKKANEAMLALCVSVSQHNVTSGLTQKLHTHFPHSDISFNSFPLAYWNAIHHIFPERKDAILLDVSGEITDVSLVRGGVLIETTSFPLGRNFVLRRVASKLGRTVPEASSLVSLFLNGGTDAETGDRLNKIIFTLKQEWLSEFQKTLAELSDGLYVPSDLFLTADDDVYEIFSSWIKEEEMSQYVMSHGKFRVVPISESILAPIVNPDGVKYDQFLNIGVLFADNMAEKTRSIV